MSLTMLYIAFVAIFNLFLGYALAVYLGQSRSVVAVSVLADNRLLRSLRTAAAAAPASEAVEEYPAATTEEEPEVVATENKPAIAKATATILTNVFDNWLLEDPNRTRKLCTALVDVDQIDEVREQFGPALVDQLLNALAGMVHRAGHEHGSVTQLGKHRFLMLYPDTTPGDAVTAVEELRQRIEKTHFQHDQQEIQMTVSCAVVEVLSDDSRELLLERVESTLEEAQQYGRNRTFLHEGEYPTPVMPPELPVDASVISI